MSNPDDAYRLQTLADIQRARLNTFLNSLRLLHNVDGRDFDAAARDCEDGASLTFSGAWQRFSADPTRWILRADDQSAAAVWRVMTAYQIGPGNPTFDEVAERVGKTRDAQLAKTVAQRDELLVGAERVLAGHVSDIEARHALAETVALIRSDKKGPSDV